jgi:hypothetical protein
MKKELIENFEYLINRINQEGFHYCFHHYSNFEEIDDEKFHELRREYLKVSKELENYINNKFHELVNLDSFDYDDDWDNTLLDGLNDL